MSAIAIFYGSDTGNTETIAEMIREEIDNNIDIYDIAESGIELFNNYSVLILGIPTWYYGEAQTDWEDYLEEIESLDLQGKTIALFGCGDQVDYSEYFLDAMGTLHDIVVARGANIIGHWPCDNYDFISSNAKVGDAHFAGLGIDCDRQPELTDSRVKQWCKLISDQLDFSPMSLHG